MVKKKKEKNIERIKKNPTPPLLVVDLQPKERQASNQGTCRSSRVVPARLPVRRRWGFCTAATGSDFPDRSQPLPEPSESPPTSGRWRRLRPRNSSRRPTRSSTPGRGEGDSMAKMVAFAFVLKHPELSVLFVFFSNVRTE